MVQKGLAIIVAISVAALASNLSAQKNRNLTEQVIKLQCSGMLNDWENKVSDYPASGVYIEITAETIKVFGIPAFPDFQLGIETKIYSRNPSMIFSKSLNDFVYITINRMSGEIKAWQYYPHTDIKSAVARRMFDGRCVNPKPIF
jgi:hypothetical protein